MMGKRGLSEIHFSQQLAGIILSFMQQFENLQPVLVRHCFKYSGLDNVFFIHTHILLCKQTLLNLPKSFFILHALQLYLYVGIFDLQFRILYDYFGKRRYGLSHERAAGNDDALSDHCFTAEDGSTGIYGYMIFNCRMTLLAGQLLSAPGGQGAQGNALIEFDIVADLCGLTDNYACTVVDKEVFADGGAGVDIDSSPAMAYSVMIRGRNGTSCT